MTMSRTFYFFCLWSLYELSVHGGKTKENGFSFASYYNDHMVLQQNVPVNIWGYSTKIGDTVHLTLKDNTHTLTKQTQVVTSSEGKGTWKIVLPPKSANDGGPYTITVTSSLSTLHINDVVFGDVWICSGQSNMQFTLSMDIDGSAQEIENGHNFPNIRLFTVHQKEANEEKYDLIDIEQQWARPSKSSLKSWDWGHFSSLCWHFGKQLNQNLKHPIGLIASSWGGTLVESWSSKDAMSKCGNKFFNYGPQPGFPRTPNVIWNSMIHPLLTFPIYGAIWYQGESNSANPSGYTCRFPAMIDDWREKFHKASNGQTSKNFPFGIVQLAPNQNNDNKGGMVEIRISQTAGYGYVPNKRMNNTFMAVTIDLPDFKSPFLSIHPRHKDIVGKRLSYGALNVAYGKHTHYQGPFPSKITNNKQDSTLTIVYDNNKTPLDIRNKDGFEICCSNQGKGSGCGIYDGSWHKVQISHSTKTSVTLPYPSECQQHNNRAHAIRYEWRESPCPFQKCAIYSVENSLPAPPFQQYLEDNETHIIG